MMRTDQTDLLVRAAIIGVLGAAFGTVLALVGLGIWGYYVGAAVTGIAAPWIGQAQRLRSSAPRSGGRRSRSVVGDFGDFLSAKVIAWWIAGVTLALGLGLIAEGTRAKADVVYSTVGGVLVAVVVLVGTLRGVWHSRILHATTKLTELTEFVARLERERARAEVEFGKAAGEVQLLRRARAYHATEIDIIHGLQFAVSSPESLGASFDRFIEENSLRPTSEVITVMLSDEGLQPRVELGIAEEIEGGFRVTHASGPYTTLLKSGKGSFYSSPDLREALAEQAVTAFNSGVYYYVAIGRRGEGKASLFALSEVPLGPPEEATLLRQANMIGMTLLARDKSRS